MIMLRVGIQVKPPLLQTYILPSGPSAAPLGPPGICATTSLRPSGQTRVRRRPRISTSTTDPSGITTGPSGNSRSVARTRTLDMKSPWLFQAAGGYASSFPRTQQLVARCYGKVDLACQATSGHRPAQGSQALRLFLDRHPDLEPAIAGERIEVLVVALEVRRVGHFQPRGRQPVIPDRVDGTADGRDVVAMAEDRISLFGDANPGEFARQVGEVGYLDTGDVVEISGIVAIAAAAIRHLSDSAGNICDRLMKAL